MSGLLPKALGVSVGLLPKALPVFDVDPNAEGCPLNAPNAPLVGMFSDALSPNALEVSLFVPPNTPEVSPPPPKADFVLLEAALPKEGVPPEANAEKPPVGFVDVGVDAGLPNADCPNPD